MESQDNEYIQYEWARIPHFYYGYYVYQYATGIACAYNFSEHILKGNTKDLNKYLNLLKSGGNDYPLSQLKKAGIDMNDTSVYDSLFKRWDNLIKELSS